MTVVEMTVVEIPIAEIHKEMWDWLDRVLHIVAPAWAKMVDMPLSTYLQKGLQMERDFLLAMKLATDEELSRQCQRYDTTLQQKIMDAAIVTASDQDARAMYENAHLVDCEGNLNGYSLHRVLWYVDRRWPELTETIIRTGRLPDVPPFVPKPTGNPAQQASERANAGAMVRESGPSGGSQTGAPITAPADPNPLPKEQQALAVLAKHPDWTDKRIAETVGVNPKSVYRWETYKAARSVQKRERRAKYARGHKDPRTGMLEASANPDDAYPED